MRQAGACTLAAVVSLGAAFALPSVAQAQAAASSPAQAQPQSPASAPAQAQPPVGNAGGEAAAAERPARARTPGDPFEGFNRAMFSFNEGLDAKVLRPVAQGYKKVVPEPMREGVSNFFGNFSDAWSAVNQLLQGKVQYGLEMGMRVTVNTVFGLGGVVDIASDAGLEKRSEDLGQTLGRWGMPPGPYLVLPFFGPSDVRDGLALPVDQLATPATFVNDTGAAIAITGLRVIDARASLLGATDLVEGIALDKYSFLRDAYVTRRRSLVYDGDPPELPEEAEPPQPAPAK